MWGKKLAKIGVDVSRPTRSNWINEKSHAYPTTWQLTKIASSFDVSADWLLGLTEGRGGIVAAERVTIERFIAERERLFVALAAFVLKDVSERLRTGEPIELDPRALARRWNRVRMEMGYERVQAARSRR